MKPTESFILRELARLWYNCYRCVPRPLTLCIEGIDRRGTFQTDAFPPGRPVTVVLPAWCLDVTLDNLRATLARVVEDHASMAVLDTSARVVSGRERLSC